MPRPASGATQSGPRSKTWSAVATVGAFPTVGFSPVAHNNPRSGQRYANLRAGLEEAGRPIGANDMLIAAHALALGCAIVTDNEKEFARVPDLSCENWLR